MAGVVERKGIGGDGRGDGQRPGGGWPDHEGRLRLAPSRKVERLGLAGTVGIQGQFGGDRIGGEILDAGKQGDVLPGDRLGGLREQAADREIRRRGGGHAVGAEDDVGRKLGGEVAPSGGLKVRDDDQLAMALNGGELAQGEVEGGGERAAFRDRLGLLELLG